ncbi:MAG: hypothetical protein FIA95_15595 [Gemmatimonadetes bacterium]|nr:hypothetical protein [Gemmatimonadota bacterium]
MGVVIWTSAILQLPYPGSERAMLALDVEKMYAVEAKKRRGSRHDRESPGRAAKTEGTTGAAPHPGDR